MSFRTAQYRMKRKRCTAGWPGCIASVTAGRAAMSTFVLIFAISGGCARRAYNDVYVENMAAEIRDLEDQLYEFDGEYRMMEQQLDALRAENARLKSGLPAPAKNRMFRESSPSDANSIENFVPRAGSSSQSSSPQSLPPATSPNKTTPSPAPSLEIGPSSPSGSAQPNP